MGLFEKKYCDICSNKIGLLGTNKLADGKICNDCCAKMSVWLKNRKSCTLEQIKAHLAYREANISDFARFEPTKKIGATNADEFFLADEKTGRFVVLRDGEDIKKNPDIFETTKVKDAKLEIVEDKKEVYRKDVNGNMVSFSPKHYRYYYKFFITIDYDDELITKLRFPISYVDIDGGADDDEYQGMSFSESLGNQFLSGLGIAPTEKRTVVKVDKWGRRHDLPGGYRSDGLTTMTPYNIEKYENQLQTANEIISFVLGK